MKKLLFIFSFPISNICFGQIINTYAGNHAPGYSGNGGPATPSFINETLPKTSFFAMDSFSFTSFTYHAALRDCEQNLPYWPVKSSWCRCSQSYSASFPFITSSSYTTS